MSFLKTLRAGLDGLYLAAGVLAAGSLVLLLLLIVLQMLARWTGEVFPGAAEYAGYAMAAASFLAFAHALNRGSHIRVSILLNAMPPAMHRLLEIWCFAIAALVMWNFVYFGQKFVYWSWRFNELSQGQDATPLWIPQSFMLLGAVVLAICLTDHLVSVLVTGRSRITSDTIEQGHVE